MREFNFRVLKQDELDLAPQCVFIMSNSMVCYRKATRFVVTASHEEYMCEQHFAISYLEYVESTKDDKSANSPVDLDLPGTSVMPKEHEAVMSVPEESKEEVKPEIKPKPEPKPVIVPKLIPTPDKK